MFLKLICVLFIIFHRNLGPSRTVTTSGLVLFVALFNGFRSWTNVGRISVLDVVWIGASIFVLENFYFYIFFFFFAFNFTSFCVVLYLQTYFVFLCFYTNEISITNKKREGGHFEQRVSSRKAVSL